MIRTCLNCTWRVEMINIKDFCEKFNANFSLNGNEVVCEEHLTGNNKKHHGEEE